MKPITVVLAVLLGKVQNMYFLKTDFSERCPVSCEIHNSSITLSNIFEDRMNENKIFRDWK